MNMIDVLYVLAERDELIKMSTNGIFPFSQAGLEDYKQAVYYDDTQPEDFGDDCLRYPVVKNGLIDEVHHDVITTYGCRYDDYSISVFVEVYEGKPEISFKVYLDADNPDNENSIEYMISDGDYYVCY